MNIYQTNFIPEANYPEYDTTKDLENETNELYRDYWPNVVALRALKAVWTDSKQKKIPKKAYKSLADNSDDQPKNPSRVITEAINNILSKHDISIKARVVEERTRASGNDPSSEKTFMSVEAVGGLDLQNARQVAQFLKLRVDYLRREIDDRDFAVQALTTANDPENNTLTITTSSPYLDSESLQALETRVNKRLYRHKKAVKLTNPSKDSSEEDCKSSSKPDKYRYKITVEEQEPSGITS